MRAQEKRNVLGVLVDAVDYDIAVARIIAAARERKSMTVSALAVHGVMMGALDSIHRYRLNHLDLVLPDGQPVRWALNWLYNAQLPDRVYGPTLMLQVCERAASESIPVYLYGSRPHVLESLCHTLHSHFPSLVIAGTQPSRFRQISAKEKQEVIRDIRSSGAAITFVGLGCPRQEIWVYEYRVSVPMPLVAVGAAFDFHAGTLPQAPPLFQRLGLEWLYRLVHEPRRLWKRYVILNPLYLSLLLLQALGLAHFGSMEAAIPPANEMRYG